MKTGRTILEASGQDDPRLNDMYSQMVETASFNPFRITTDYLANTGLQLGDLVDVFQKELEERLTICKELMPEDMVMSVYCFDMLKTYFQHGGYIPKLMMDEIIDQVFEAMQKTTVGHHFPSSLLEKFRYKMYHDLTHK